MKKLIVFPYASSEKFFEDMYKPGNKVVDMVTLVAIGAIADSAKPDGVVMCCAGDFNDPIKLNEIFDLAIRD